MNDYSKFIAPERRSVPTPRNMVENGKCVFGTFDKEFETMDLLGIDNPTSAPDFLSGINSFCFSSNIRFHFFSIFAVGLEVSIITPPLGAVYH